MAIRNIQDSYTELLKSFEYTPRNFKLTRNVPLDTRFIVENIENIDNEIPKAVRYPGLIFFVKDSNVNDGTTQYLDGTKKLGSTGSNKGIDKIFGILYIFDDKCEPIPLHDLITRFEIRLLNIDNSTDDCYGKLTDRTENTNEHNSLNHLFAKIGNIVFIEPLGIAVICRLINGQPEWRYLTGSYNVLNETQFLNIPKTLRQPNVDVTIDDKKYIITHDGYLSDEIIKTDSKANCTEDRRFYNINGFIYYHIAGITIPVSNKFLVKTIDLQKGNNELEFTEQLADGIDHTIFDSNFNTRNIIIDCIKEPEGNSIIDAQYANMRFPIQHKIISINKINIISSIDVKNVTLIIRVYE